MLAIILCVLAYLLGSVNSAIILSKLFHLPDPRLSGSGNPGATNVLRSGNKQIAIAVLLFDALKGLIPVLITRMFGLTEISAALVGMFALVGHIFPVFFNFKGGKGVATFLGVTFGMSFALGLLAVVVWLILAFVMKYSSLASLVSAVVATLAAPFMVGSGLVFFPFAMMTAILVWRHQENIERLKAGTESKIGK